MVISFVKKYNRLLSVSVVSATCLCRSVVVSVNIFLSVLLSVFVCELTFGQLSVGELSHNGEFGPLNNFKVQVKLSKQILLRKAAW